MNRKLFSSLLLFLSLLLSTSAVVADDITFSNDVMFTNPTVSPNGISAKAHSVPGSILMDVDSAASNITVPTLNESVFADVPLVGQWKFGLSLGFSNSDLSVSFPDDQHVLYKFGLGTSLKSYGAMKEFFNDFDNMSNEAFDNKYGNLLAGPKAGVAGDISGQVFLYLYGEKTSSGTYKVVDGEVGVNVNASLTYTAPFPPLPIIYLRVRGSIGAKAYLFWECRPDKIYYKGAFQPELMLRAGVGVDIVVASAEGGVEGKLPIKIVLADNASLANKITVDFTGGAYIELRELCFKQHWSYTWVDCHIYPSLTCSKDSSSTAKSLPIFEMIPRDYLKTASAFAAAPEAKVLARDGLSTKEVLKSSVMPNSTTKLIALADGREMLLWLDDDPNRTDINRSMLYYAIRSNGVWSAEKAVNDDDTYDSDFDAVYQDGKVYITWVDLQKNLAQDTSLEAMLAQTDIVAIIYDAATDSFSPRQLLSSGAAGSEGHPIIALSDTGTRASVIWQLNSSADHTTESGINRLLSAEYDGTNWTKGVSLYETEEKINSYDAAYLNGERTLVLSRQTAAGETEKYDLFKVDGIGNTTQLTNDTVSNMFPLLRLENGFLQLYWAAGESLKTLDLSAASPEPVLITDQANAIRGFEVLGQGEDKLILWENPLGWKTHISAIFRDPEKWGQPVELLAGQDGSLDGLSAYLDNSGGLRLSALTAEVAATDFETNGLSTGEAFYGTYDLIYATIENQVTSTSLSAETFVSYRDVDNNTDVPINITLSNFGNQPLEKVRVILTDAQGTQVLEKYVDIGLDSGASGTFEVLYHLPSRLEQADYHVSVLPATNENVLLKEIYPGDNANDVTIGQTVLSILNMDVTNYGASTHIKVKLCNIGFDESNEVKLTLSDYNSDKVIATKTVASLAAGAEIDYEFDVPTADFDFSDGTEEAVAYVEISSGNDDLSAIDSSAALVPLKAESLKEDDNRLIFYFPEWFESDMRLPGTGFPTHIITSLRARPAGLNYDATNFELSIPTIDLNTRVVNLPRYENSWAVEWLGADAGLMEGTPELGSGISWIAAHNHLNTLKAGPFARLSSLSAGDVIFLRQSDGTLSSYQVSLNKLYPEDGFEQVFADLPTVKQGLVLLTCENEATDGSYQNRRLIFAQ